MAGTYPNALLLGINPTATVAAECFKAIWYPGFDGRAVMAGKVGAEGREIVE